MNFVIFVIFTGENEMEILKQRILKDGVVKAGNILKVDSFLNHQMDVRLFRQFNAFPLPADQDGSPTWHNLLADLRQLLLMARTSGVRPETSASTGARTLSTRRSICG